MAPSGYRIVRFEAENIKRIVAVAITPTGSVIELTGENEMGKSSILDAIWWAFSGEAEIEPSPIRAGEETARIHVDLGTLKVTRTFKVDANKPKGYTTKLIVEAEDGFRGTQSTLNALIGELAFDPLEFTRMKPQVQFDVLKRFVPGFDFDEIAMSRKTAFDERTDVNRRLKDIRGQISGIVFPEDTPSELIDESALVDELEGVHFFNKDIEDRTRNRAAMLAGADASIRLAEEDEAEAAALREQADELDARAKRRRDDAEADRKKVADAKPLADLKSTEEVRERLTAAKATNADVMKRAEKNRLEGVVKDFIAEADKLTVAIDDIDVKKEAAIASAKMPVEGIGFGDGYVMLNGLPLEQASGAVKLKTSMAIAFALNPRLRIVRVTDGSLLDDKSMAVVVEMAEKFDMQVWMETVTSGRKSAFYIEDGMVLREPEVAE